MQKNADYDDYLHRINCHNVTTLTNTHEVFYRTMPHKFLSQQENQAEIKTQWAANEINITQFTLLFLYF